MNSTQVNTLRYGFMKRNREVREDYKHVLDLYSQGEYRSAGEALCQADASFNELKEHFNRSKDQLHSKAIREQDSRMAFNDILRENIQDILHPGHRHITYHVYH